MVHDTDFQDGFDRGGFDEGPYGDPEGLYTVTTSDVTPTSFTVSWSTSVDVSNVDRYNVHIATSGGQVVADEDVQSPPYAFGNASPETQYTVWITALRVDGSIFDTVGSTTVTTPAEDQPPQEPPDEPPLIESLGSVVVVGGAAVVVYQYFKNGDGS